MPHVNITLLIMVQTGSIVEENELALEFIYLHCMDWDGVELICKKCVLTSGVRAVRD